MRGLVSLSTEFENRWLANSQTVRHSIKYFIVSTNLSQNSNKFKSFQIFWMKLNAAMLLRGILRVAMVVADENDWLRLGEAWNFTEMLWRRIKLMFIVWVSFKVQRNKEEHEESFDHPTNDVVESKLNWIELILNFL